MAHSRLHAAEHINGTDDIQSASNSQKGLATSSHITDIEANNGHRGTTSGNPHSVSKSDVGLGNVTDDAQIPSSLKGAANGVAELDAGGKVPVAQLPDTVVGALDYKGTWDADSNDPDLPGSTPDKGDYYRVSVAGSTSLGGITDWEIGDWAIYNGAAWEKLDQTETVNSVVGQTGDVSAAQVKTALEGEDDFNTFTDDDHDKLDGIDAGADVTADNDPKAHAASHKGGGGDEIDAATQSVNGLMSSGDKTKLDGVDAGADVTADAMALLGDLPCDVYEQADEPTLGANERFGFWRDTDNEDFFLILRVNGTQKKVQLT